MSRRNPVRYRTRV